MNTVKIPCNTLTEIKGRGVHQILSDEHQVVYWTNKNTTSKPKITPFCEVRKRHENSKKKGWTGNIKTTFNYSGSGIDFSEGELRLQVAVMADGRVVKEGKNNYTQMRFSKERKYKRLIELCRRFNLPHKDNGSKLDSRYLNNTEYEVIVYPKKADKVFDHSYYACTSDQISIILDEVFHWDGSIPSKTMKRYFSVNKDNADFIQFCAASKGLNTSITEDTREDRYTNSHYTVNCSTVGNGFRCIANKDRKAELVEVPTSDGFKYCLETSTGMLVLRSNNSIFITGNSGKSHLMLMHPLQHIRDKNFNGIFFRRVTTQLVGAGGLWDESQKMYKPFKTHTVRKPQYQHKFPSGATLTFAHMQHEDNCEDHQGLTY